ncbi:hypothetical protein F2Q69_00058428 [Brassica cretica]|uniref:Uncharacterized protein n=1 Tax=Brassica cretica TaxID=69181 RepID=A0A8S9RM25_BRACR|nr:hypothetical protein F2Q69_00058428 [Brassica cretica]
MHGFGSYPSIDVRDSSVATSDLTRSRVGRYVATDRMAWFTGRSLRSDRTSGLVGRYVATDLFAGRSLAWLVATFDESTKNNARFHCKALRKDFLELRVFDTLPRDVREQCAEFRARPRSNHGFKGCDDYFDLRFPFDESTKNNARFHRKALRKDFFTEITLLERDKIGAAPYDGCLRILVEGIKPFVVRLGVKFSAVCKLARFLKTLEYWPRDKFWDLVSGCLILCLEMLESSVLSLGQDLGLITALRGAMTTSTYVSRIVFDLIQSRFKFRDMFSAYLTCIVGIEHLFEDNF